MPRNIQITVPSDQTERFLTIIKESKDLIGLRVQRQISLHPPGDVITAELSTRSMHELIRRLQAAGAGAEATVTTSDPLSIISVPMAEVIASDASEGTWEEMELNLAKESNMTVNGLLLMFTAGAVACLGLATNALHIVIGAMVIAPGFEPISRVALGAIGRSAAWKRGLADIGKGYVALILGALVTALILRALGKSPSPGESSYYPRAH